MKHKRGKILVILGCCCLIAAAALYGYNRWVSSQAAEKSAELTALLQKSIASGQETGLDPFLEADSSGPADSDSSENLKTVNIQGYELAGVISIGDIGIELPVISEWSYPALKTAPCRYSGTPDGQMILLAHNYPEHFGRLKDLTAGSAVTFTSADGKAYHYTVSRIETIDGDRLDGIVAGTDWDLTLFTCTYSGRQRVVVRCVRAS
jgi:sortase A